MTWQFRTLALLALVTAAAAHGQWQMQTSNTTADLRGIDNVGNGVAWASGTNGTVLRTEDGGYVWQTCAVPPGAEKLDFRGVQAFDANTAIVMSSGKGDLSRLYKTEDGCHSWKLVFTNPDKDGFWDAVQFVDNKVGTLLGDPVHGQFQIWGTIDGGLHWRPDGKSKALRAKSELSGAFAASNSSLTLGIPKTAFPMFATGGTAGSFAYSITGDTRGCVDCDRPPGDHWKKTKVPVTSGSDSAGVFSLLIVWPLYKGVAVGGDYQQPDEASSTAAFTFDDGDSWFASQTPPHGYRSSVAYDATIKTWITVGPNGTDISSDDGKNWRAVHPSAALHEAVDADRDWNAISLPYVVGPRGRIGRLDEAVLKQGAESKPVK